MSPQHCQVGSKQASGIRCAYLLLYDEFKLSCHSLKREGQPSFALILTSFLAMLG